MPCRASMRQLTYAAVAGLAVTVAPAQLNLRDVAGVTSCHDLTEKISHAGEKVRTAQTNQSASQAAPDLSASAAGV